MRKRNHWFWVVAKTFAGIISGIIITLILTAGAGSSPIIRLGWDWGISYVLAFVVAGQCLAVVALLVMLEHSNAAHDDLVQKLGLCYYEDDPVEDVVTTTPGKLYVELGRQINRAQVSVRALFMASTADKNNSALHTNKFISEARLKYFKIVEEKLKSKSQDFTYERIFQHPPELALNLDEKANLEQISDQFDDGTLRHCKAVLKLHDEGKAKVIFTRVPTQRLTGFVLIDDKVLILITGGIDSAKRAYHAGAFFFERNESDPLIQNFKKRFDHIKTLGRHIDNRELLNVLESKAIPQVATTAGNQPSP